MNNGAGQTNINSTTVPAPSAESTKIREIQDNYDDYSKEDLIDKIRKLTCHVKQLQNVIRRDSEIQSSDSSRIIKKAKRDRPFDFSR